MGHALPLRKDDLIGELDGVWASIRGVVVDLSDEEWTTPTRLPGWCVRDAVAHMIGTESMLAGRDMPDVTVDEAPHLQNDIGRFNEGWVIAHRECSGAEMIDRFDAVTTERLAALRAMSQADFDADAWTPAGQRTYGRFMQIRVFDCWMHEQDIRDALGRPGHLSGPVVDRALAEIATALGYVVGKKGGAPAGSSISLRIDGPTARRFDVVVAERAELVDEPLREPTAIIDTDLSTFAALVGGRGSIEDAMRHVAIEGDRELGDRVARNLAFVI